jgi:histidinol-phosphate/aromatic aminotransferase/cobyric acid decarboxylase-like protein
MTAKLRRHDKPIDLSRNSMPLDLDEIILELKKLWRGSGKLGPYSDDNRCEVGVSLREAIAKHEGVPVGNVRVVGSLLPEIETMAARLQCRNVVIAELDFPQYRRALLLSGSQLVQIPVALDSSDLDPVKAADAVIGRDRPMVFLTMSHMNPGMTKITWPVVTTIREANPESVVVVNGAYRRFGEPQDYVSKVIRDPQLIFLQTASKHLGMCGARVGWMIAHHDMLQRLDRALEPHLASALLPYAAGIESKRAVLNLLEHPEVVDRITSLQQAARLELVQGLSRHGLRVKAHDAVPWVLLDLGVEVLRIITELADANIFIQPQDPSIPSLRHWARISATVPWQARAVVDALEELTAGYQGIPKSSGKGASSSV